MLRKSQGFFFFFFLHDFSKQSICSSELIFWLEMELVVEPLAKSMAGCMIYDGKCSHC